MLVVKEGGNVKHTEEVPGGFASLEAALNGPKGAFFGVTTENRRVAFGDGTEGVRSRRVPRDPCTRYTAGGVSGEEEPKSYFFNLEISNNSILCSANDTGLLEHPCIYSRLVATRRRGREFLAEELLCGSPWGFALAEADDRPVYLPMTHGITFELLHCLYPVYHFVVGDIRARLLVFAPDAAAPEAEGVECDFPRALITVMELHNSGAGAWSGRVIPPRIADALHPGGAGSLAAPAASPHPHFTEHPVPMRPAYEGVHLLDGLEWSTPEHEIVAELQPGNSASYALAFILGEEPGELSRTAKILDRRSALEWLNASLAGRLRRYGNLEIPSDRYYEENRIRLAEQAASSILYSRAGQQFKGGPSGAWDFGMSLVHPSYLEPSLQGYETDEYSPLDPTASRYSLTRAVWNLVAIALYHQMTDDRERLRTFPGLLRHAQRRLADVLATRRGEPYLFPSTMIWDGPSLGDYHTGSNILAWKAFSGMAAVARGVYAEASLADEWLEVAERLRNDIYARCVGNTDAGPRFYEGANEDGSFAAGHDGEEAFTTLAPFFGFCQIDEPALINHAKLAFTTENPLYEPAVDGIWWDERGKYGSGITIPGQMAMLAAVSDEQELHARLEQLREMTDMDGSLWWWPYLFPCSDRRSIMRHDGPSDTSKCGYAASIYTCLFIHNILGLSLDLPERRVGFRPFTPWPAFTWRGCRIGRTQFDIEYVTSANEVRAALVNRNSSRMQCTIELTLPRGAVLLEPAPQDAVASTRFGRQSVCLGRPIRAGERLELRASIRQES
jgi:hypothetical protein